MRCFPLVFSILTEGLLGKQDVYHNSGTQKDNVSIALAKRELYSYLAISIFNV